MLQLVSDDVYFHTFLGRVIELQHCGNVKPVLTAYQTILSSTCRNQEDYDMNENGHRDKLCVSLLQNAGIETVAEYEVHQRTKTTGYADIMIKAGDRWTVLELKICPHTFLELNSEYP